MAIKKFFKSLTRKNDFDPSKEFKDASNTSLDELDLIYYKKKYPDLKELTDEELRKHWEAYGQAEGRFASYSHEMSSIKESNKRVIEENSELSDIVLDADYYQEVYFDLAGMNNEEIQNHWINHGFFEGRYASIAHAIEKEALADLTIDEEIRIVSASSFFSTDFYERNNLDVAKSTMEGVEHYVKYGWKERRLPSADFDSHWYEQNYFFNSTLNVNPVVFHERVGKKLRHKTKPQYTNLNKGHSLGDTPKRICLFAAYDKDGIIDDYVIEYVKELSYYCDVFFLMDSEVSSKEFSKIKLFTKGAWAYRHGEYDFGSYKRLADYHVGWNAIEQYDELLLVNDSSYLLHSLDNVFNKMANEEVSWWGMQATKGMISTKDKESNCFRNKIPLEVVKKESLPQYFEEECFDFHIGTYFIAFRNNIIKNQKFKALINNVCKQRNKKTVILMYEFGLTKMLLDEGYNFGTYIDDLYPLHPIYTDIVYDLMEKGFPLLKRYFLTENHYKQKELYKWKSRIGNIYPEANIAAIEKNLYRVADATKLYKNLDIENNDLDIYSNEDFMSNDKRIGVNRNCWVFPVCGFNHNLDDNIRAVFEEVRDDPTIQKVVLYRSKFINLGGVNTKYVPLVSREGQDFLLKSFVIFIKHTPWRNTLFPLDSEKHKFVNLWHGIPFKRIGAASLDNVERLNDLSLQHEKCFSVISSSDIDRLAMTACFYPLKYSDIWVTGLPRHDFIMKDRENLPKDLVSEIEHAESVLQGRRFILYAPTFRNNQAEDYYSFNENEKKALYSFLEKNNIMLGIREHMADSAGSYTAELDHPMVFDAGNRVFQSVEMLYRASDVLVTDYSSCFIDYMLTNKPMISFAYDYDRYKEKERGTFYELDFAFPGPICKTFDGLISALKNIIEIDFHQEYQDYNAKKEIFFKYNDQKNSQRVVSMIKQLEAQGSEE